MTAFLELFGPTVTVFKFIFQFWWIWLAPLTFVLFLNTWIAYIQNIYKSKIDWTLLEIRMPRQIEKTPKAMEQFFAALYGVRNAAGDPIETYWDGEVTLWFSIEVISLGGDIHFYIRTPTKHKGVLMANLYSNYPMIDIETAHEDYMKKFPSNVRGLYEKGYKIWGTELTLANNDAYPIRTYLQYEHQEESMSLDPFGTLLEVFGKLNPQENVLLQILIRPADPKYRESAQKVVDDIKKKTSGRTPEGAFQFRTPGETDTLKAVEDNISKAQYETLIRYIYIADARIYSENFAKRGTLTAFNQYADQSLNFFKHNYKVYTQVKWVNFPYFFPKRRGEARRARLYQNFINRRMPEESTLGRVLSAHFFSLNFAQRTCHMSIESLATLFHPPTHIIVTAPLIERVEAKKMGPPANLPIYQDQDKENS